MSEINGDDESPEILTTDEFFKLLTGKTLHELTQDLEESDNEESKLE